MEQERVKPILIKDPETGAVKYTLEFSRKTVKLAERNGFKIDEVGDYPMTKPIELFYYALQMHHRGVTMDMAEKLYVAIGASSNEDFMKRLGALYYEPFRAMQDEAEENEKNGPQYVLEM